MKKIYFIFQKTLKYAKEYTIIWKQLNKEFFGAERYFNFYETLKNKAFRLYIDCVYTKVTPNDGNGALDEQKYWAYVLVNLQVHMLFYILNMI